MFGEYKLIAYAIIALLLVGIGTTAVLSYNHYVAKAAVQEEQIKLRDQIINDQQAMVAEQKRQTERLKLYQENSEKRRIASENRVKDILTTEVKRDEKTGKITPDDPVLGGLNSMYPAATIDTGKADHPPGPAVPPVKNAAGGVAGGKDILPK